MPRLTSRLGRPSRNTWPAAGAVVGARIRQGAARFLASSADDVPNDVLRRLNQTLEELEP